MGEWEDSYWQVNIDGCCLRVKGIIEFMLYLVGFQGYDVNCKQLVLRVFRFRVFNYVIYSKWKY